MSGLDWDECDIDALPEVVRIALAAQGRTCVHTGLLRRVRLAARMSQGELARSVGVSATAVNLWESGERTPRWDAAIRLARVVRGLLVVLPSDEREWETSERFRRRSPWRGDQSRGERGRFA